MTEIVVCLIGKEGVGKSTLSNLACEQLNKDIKNVKTTVLSFATPVKELIKLIDGVDVFEDKTKRQKREYIVALAEGMKKVTNNRYVWADVLVSKALSFMHDNANEKYAGSVIIIDDMRFPEENQKLRTLACDHFVIFNIAGCKKDLMPHDKIKTKYNIDPGQTYVFDLINIHGYKEEAAMYITEEIKQLLTCKMIKMT